jgi:hypothetical protein
MKEQMMATLPADDLNKLLQCAQLMQSLYELSKKKLQKQTWKGWAEYMLNSSGPANMAAKKALYDAWLALPEGELKDSYSDKLWAWDDSDLY